MTRNEVLDVFRTYLPTTHSETLKGLVDALIAVDAIKVDSPPLAKRKVQTGTDPDESWELDEPEK